MDLECGDAVVVALGGNRTGGFVSSEALFEAALDRFPSAGLTVVKRSCWWRSAAWPDPSQSDYRNGVAIVETPLSPVETMAALHWLETEFGRRRTIVNAPRTLDLDLIAYGRVVIHDGALTLPHPRAHERLFVMGPLAEIAPAWVHPVSGRTAAMLAEYASVGRDARPV